MALIKCKECEGDVSTSAQVCPKCGAPVKRVRWGNVVAALLLVVVGLFVFVAMERSDQDKAIRNLYLQNGAVPPR